MDTAEVVEVHYWTLLIRGEYRHPNGEEYPARYGKPEEAGEKLDRLVLCGLVKKFGE